jgi:hypothetical protein
MKLTRVLATRAVGTGAAVVAAAALSAPAGAGDDVGAMQAGATIVNASGDVVGFAHLTEDAHGRVHLNVKAPVGAPRCRPAA